MARHFLTILLCISACAAPAQTSVTYDNRSGVSHWIVSDVIQDSLGFIWLSTWNGLNRFDGYEFRRMKAQPGDGTDIRSEVIRRMKPDGRGNIVCLTENGAFSLDTRTYRLADAPGTSARCAAPIKRTAPFRDREGNLWQPERYGITKTSTAHHPARHVGGTENVQARAFMRDGDNGWWLATKEDECIRIYDSSNRLKGFLGADGRVHGDKTPFRHRAYTLVRTRCGDIWAGCKPGALIRMRKRNDGTYEIKRIRSRELRCDIVYHIAEDGDGRLWLATFGGGVACIPDPRADNPEAVSFTVRDAAGTRCKARRILVTRSGNIVCATTDGIITGRTDRRDVRRSVLRRLSRDGRRAASLCNNATMDVVQDNAGRIFIATENSGIDMTTEDELFKEQPSFTHFNTANSQLTSDACLAMAVKDGRRIFVVGTDRVTDFAPDGGESVTYSRRFWCAACHFSEERPLLLPDGSWLFGQEQGAYIATRHCLYTRGYVPPLLFTELAVCGRPPLMGICAMDTVVIGTDERNFSISFAALDYTDNTDIRYRSRLDGSPWSRASGDRSLTFYDMLPGEHTLTVQSTDRYGRWVDNTRSLTIIVTPRWHETLWARIAFIVLIAAAAAGAAFTAVYIRSLNRQRRELLAKYMALLDRGDGTGHAEVAEREAPPAAELPDADRRFLERVMKYVGENIANGDANIDDMAAYAATSRSNLNRKLRSLVGVTAAQLLIDARMQKAEKMLHDAAAEDKPSIAEIAYSCGYADPRYFSRCFKQKYGTTPSEYHRRERA